MDTFDYTEVVQSGPICIKRDPIRNVIQLEAWAILNGERRCVRSFSLYVGRLGPDALKILEVAIAKRRDSIDLPGSISTPESH